MIRKNSILFIFTLLLFAPSLPAAEKTAPKEGQKTEKHPTTLTVEDLGFSGDETKSNLQYQKDLQARSDMLQIHQTLGIITALPMTAEFVLGIVTTGNVANG